MKRLFVSAAALPLLYAATAHAETKISTTTTAPIATATASGGAADDVTIESAGSIALSDPGAAVTLNSNNSVANAGKIAFNNVSGARGVAALGGFAGSIANTGSISLLEDYDATDTDGDGDIDGPFAQGSDRVGILVSGAAPFVGSIANSGAIAVEGNDSAGIRVDGRLSGSLNSSGTVTVVGDRSVGIAASAVDGDVTVSGGVSAVGQDAVGLSLGDVVGGVKIQGGVTATGYGSTTRLADAARAKLDADDLLQGGAAVRIAGSVGRGVLLDAPPDETNPDSADDDNDGVPDASEGTAAVYAFGAAPALDIGAAAATTLGRVGTGDYGYGLVIRGGEAAAYGVNDGVAATAVRIGQDGGGRTVIEGGIHVLGGKITALAYGADVAAQGGAATALLVNANAEVPSLRNSGVISATLSGGSQDARAIVDLSGGLALVENLGAISAVTTPKAGSTHIGQAIAIDLSANTSGAVVRQTLAASTSTPSIVGDVRFGSGADRLELLGGTLVGDMSFGAGRDTLVLDNGASATGAIIDSDGLLDVTVANGRLSVTNTGAVRLSGLTLGGKGVLAVVIDPAASTATRFDVSGQATIATGAQVDLSLSSLLRSQRTYEIVKAGVLTAGDASASLVGAPWLYTATLVADTTGGSLSVDLRPKTAAELGLGRSGAQAFDAVFESLDRDRAIEAAFLGAQTQDAFNGLYDQMLPDHSGASLMSAQALSAAVSSAVARPSLAESRESGGFWAQEIMFQIDRRRGDAMGFRSRGFGLAAGLETVGSNNALGLSTSFVTTDYRDRGAAVGEQVAMNIFEGGAYWRFEAGGLKADLRGGLGYVRFDSERRLVDTGAALDLTADAKWSGWLANAHAGLSYEARAGRFYARPELSADYLRLSEGDYEESGGGAGFDLAVDRRTGDLMTGQALLALGARFGDEVFLIPEVKVGWRAKLAGGAGATTARFLSGGPGFSLDPEDVYSGGLVARAGVRGGSQTLLFAVEGGGAFDSDYKEYDLRALVRFRF